MLKRGKSQGSQTTVQQSPIDVGKQLLKDTPKVGQVVPAVEGFKQTNAAQNSRPSAFATLRAL